MSFISRLPKKIEPKKIAVFTGTAFMQYLEEFAEKLRGIEGLSLDLFKIENRLFGQSVTVTGLLAGRDVLKAIVGKTNEESLGMEVLPIEATPAGLLKGIRDGIKRKN
jgi:NifB/MoaA-like Fe-S oxidoreductase